MTSINTQQPVSMPPASHGRRIDSQDKPSPRPDKQAIQFEKTSPVGAQQSVETLPPVPSSSSSSPKRPLEKEAGTKNASEFSGAPKEEKEAHLVFDPVRKSLVWEIHRPSGETEQIPAKKAVRAYDQMQCHTPEEPPQTPYEADLDPCPVEIPEQSA